jgi:hypothetical protein
MSLQGTPRYRLAPFLALLLALAAPTVVDALPLPGAHADAFATFQGAPATGTPSQDGQNSASADQRSDPFRLLLPPDEGPDPSGIVNIADSEADATVPTSLAPGVVKSRSFAGADTTFGSRTRDDVSAHATASWVATFTTTGTNPFVPIDVDAMLHLTGVLGVFSNGPGDVFSRVDATVTFFTNSVALPPAFNGSATAFDEPLGRVVQRTGDWANPAFNADFTSDPDALGLGGFQVDTNTLLQNALFIGFGQPFAVKLELTTQALSFPLELYAGADFSNTGSIDLSTDTPGVTIQLVGGAPSAVPEPSALLLFGIGLVGLLRMTLKRS